MCEEYANQKSAAHGSRRRRIWELPHQCHCSVVGVCFPLLTLRQLVNKAMGCKAAEDDYELHVGTVAECSKRNRLSELLQKDLDVRYARSVQTFKSAKNTGSVTELWTAAVQRGDLPGALWATLTHPRCDDALQEVVLRDMHMLQHQAGAASRVDMARFNEMVKEHGVLVRELARAQERCTRVISDKAAEIESLNKQLIRQRAISVGKETRIAFLVQDMAQLKSELPEFQNTSKLRKKIDQLMARQAELELQNSTLRHKVSDAQRALERHSQTERSANKTSQPTEEPKCNPNNMILQEKTILCVGGRSGNVSNYRDVIERAGGHFAHHDGGQEDSHSALDSVLAAADLVICQTGCVSHNAYWRVKDFCKRTGKQCVFVENPSTSSLTRTLQQIALDTPVIEQTTNVQDK